MFVATSSFGTVALIGASTAGFGGAGAAPNGCSSGSS
jgi:hypothetical protein